MFSNDVAKQIMKHKQLKNVQHLILVPAASAFSDCVCFRNSNTDSLTSVHSFGACRRQERRASAA